MVDLTKRTDLILVSPDFDFAFLFTSCSALTRAASFVRSDSMAKKNLLRRREHRDEDAAVESAFCFNGRVGVECSKRRLIVFGRMD